MFPCVLSDRTTGNGMRYRAVSSRAILLSMIVEMSDGWE
jgi:hypothetical protein